MRIKTRYLRELETENEYSVEAEVSGLISVIFLHRKEPSQGGVMARSFIILIIGD